MSTFCIPFDPTSVMAPNRGTLITSLGKDAGTLLVLNDSAVNVIFTLASGQQKFTPAQSWRRLEIPGGNDTIQWQQQAILPMNVPNSQVYCEAFASSEDVPEVFPAALVRATTVAGGSSISTLSNETSPAGTLVIDMGTVANPMLITLYNDGRIITQNLIEWGLQQGAYAELTSFTDANGAAAVMSSQQAGAATYIQFVTWNGSAAKSPLGIGSQAVVGAYEGMIIGDTGAILRVGGVTTGGTIGVSPIVASTPSAGVHVTTTAATTILTFTPSGAGLYRANASISSIDAGVVTLSLGFTDPNTAGVVTGIPFIAAVNPGYSPITAYSPGANATVVAMPLTFPAAAGSAITVVFQNTHAAPSDFVRATIERLA